MKKDPSLTPAQNTEILNTAKASLTHWRYSLFAIRCLRSLVRRDVPLTASHISFFLDKTHDSHPNMVKIVVHYNVT